MAPWDQRTSDDWSHRLFASLDHSERRFLNRSEYRVRKRGITTAPVDRSWNTPVQHKEGKVERLPWIASGKAQG